MSADGGNDGAHDVRMPTASENGGGHHERIGLRTHRGCKDSPDAAVARMRGVREDQVTMGASPDVSDLRCDVVLRFIAQPARQQACARKRASGDRISRARRALALLLPGRGVRGVLSALSPNRDTNPASRRAVLRRQNRLHRRVGRQGARPSSPRVHLGVCEWRLVASRSPVGPVGAFQSDTTVAAVRLDRVHDAGSVHRHPWIDRSLPRRQQWGPHGASAGWRRRLGSPENRLALSQRCRALEWTDGPATLHFVSLSELSDIPSHNAAPTAAEY